MVSPDNISINLVKSDSTALGLSGASGVKEFTSGRVTSFNYSTNLAASDIKINSQNALAATLTSNLTSGNNTATALVTAINANANSHGAIATGFNKLTSAAKSSFSSRSSLSFFFFGFEKNLSIKQSTNILIPSFSLKQFSN